MFIAVYPGSFDPVTNGHIDIIERAARIFERVIVAVIENPDKQPLFTIKEREDMLRAVTAHLRNVEIDSFSGLTVNFVKSRGAQVIIRGLRAVSDFEYEFQMALINRKLNPDIETVFLMTNEKFSFLSSSAVKQMARYGGSTSNLVPPQVEEQLKIKFERKNLNRGNFCED